MYTMFISGLPEEFVRKKAIALLCGWRRQHLQDVRVVCDWQGDIRRAFLYMKRSCYGE